MLGELDFDLVDEALRRCGANWNAAQAHGLITSQLAVRGEVAPDGILGPILEGCARNDALRTECEAILLALYRTTRQWLTERLSAFALLLPDDSAGTDVRTMALAHWSEGFLHGLVSGPQMSEPQSTLLRSRLADAPIADIIKDMLEITRAGSMEGDNDEDEEEAYTEIVEYMRVAAQLVYEELAAFRTGSTI
ncbi:MAG TPA: YecA family protein [Woeseiaceae bacterium]|nr:YecA family protein [Woeseiaceae bacterium]